METVPSCGIPENLNGYCAGGGRTVFVLRPNSDFRHQIEPTLHVPMQGQETIFQPLLQCLWLWAINLETELTKKCPRRIFAANLGDDPASYSRISNGIKCYVLTPHGRRNFGGCLT